MQMWGKEGRIDPFKNIYDVRAVIKYPLFLIKKLIIHVARISNDREDGDLRRALWQR